MLTSEVLDKAADEIERRGWTQDTADPWGGGAGSDAPICIEGGIAASMGLDLTDKSGLPFEDMITCPAYAAVASYLALPSREECGELWRWNDGVCTTQAEVIEVLRAAAMVERTREAAADRVSA